MLASGRGLRVGHNHPKPLLHREVTPPGDERRHLVAICGWSPQCISPRHRAEEEFREQRIYQSRTKFDKNGGGPAYVGLLDLLAAVADAK